MKRLRVITAGAAVALSVAGCSGPGPADPPGAVVPGTAPAPTVTEVITEAPASLPAETEVIATPQPAARTDSAAAAATTPVETTVATTVVPPVTTTAAPQESEPGQDLPDLEEELEEFEELDDLLAELDDLLADLDAEWTETEGDVNP
ncbi:MAG: hypothetical protein ACE5GC_00685 [Acidimicrobiia bacterium]